MKKILSLLLFALVLTAGAVSAKAYAADKIPQPAVTAKVEKNNVKLTIPATGNADGYRIYVKAPGSKSYKPLAYIKKDGSKTRTYTVKGLGNGKYYFKVKAYTVNKKGKKVFGAAGKAVSAKVEYEGITIENPVKEFVLGSSVLGASEEKPYPVKASVAKDYNDLILRILPVDEKGNLLTNMNDSIVLTGFDDLSFAGTRMGTARLRVFGYATAEDANDMVNPVTWSKILTVRITNEEGRCPDDPEIFADITFLKNGNVLFGSYYQKAVSDSGTVVKLNEEKNKSHNNRVEYNGVKYMYNDDLRKWYGASPVEWNVLEKTDKYVVLISKNILLTTGYSDGSNKAESYTWKGSFPRAVINGYDCSGFKNIWTWDFFGVLFEGKIQRVLMEQKYDGCRDKVLLPSKDLLSKLPASDRIKTATDLAQDTYPKTKTTGYWCMDYANKKAAVVKSKGEFDTASTFLQDFYGIVPVIKVSLENCKIIEEGAAEQK